MKKLITAISLFVVAVVIMAWYWFDINTAEPVTSVSGGNLSVETEDNNPLPEINVTVTPDVGSLPLYKGRAIDDIGNDPFIQQVPPEYLQKYTVELADFKVSLARNPADADAWIRVGVLKKFFNDYLGARDAWEYAKVVNPWYSTAYYNLGDLYGWYLKDFPRAEENYLKAIEVDPTLAYLYISLAEFYNVVYKTKSAQAVEVIRRGLEVLPDDADLKKVLEYYTSR